MNWNVKCAYVTDNKNKYYKVRGLKKGKKGKEEGNEKMENEKKSQSKENAKPFAAWIWITEYVVL